MITFLGDIALLKPGISSQYKPDGDYMANFEYVCIDSALQPTPGKINIASPYNDFQSIFGRPPFALSVANNHILDYGLEGFKRTVSAIEDKGIPTVGNRVCWYNDDVCILAYTLFCGGWNGQDIVQFSKNKVKKEIEEVRNKGARCIIVNMHWGIENYSLPDKEQIVLGHWLIDNGVDLVIGHHPHCIQPVEEYKNHYIFYSLGNCIFPSFNVPSHFDEKGVAHRKYRFKWRRWNNKGVAVKYDERCNKLIAVDELCFENNVLKCTKHNVSVTKYISMNRQNIRFAKIRFAFRKYWLFFVSNSFVDGKIFDFNALKSELRK